MADRFYSYTTAELLFVEVSKVLQKEAYLKAVQYTEEVLKHN